MKKFGWGITIALLGVFLLPATGQAAPTTVIVSGLITDHGSPVARADVFVACGNIGNSSRSNASGHYENHFSVSECPSGSLIKVMSAKGTKAGSISAILTGFTLRLDVELKDFSVPEYDLASGLATTVLVAIGLLWTRQRCK